MALSGHLFLHGACLLLTQSGHAVAQPPRPANYDGFIPRNRRAADIQFPRVCTSGDQLY
jgi:hypothetical protein